MHLKDHLLDDSSFIHDSEQNYKKTSALFNAPSKMRSSLTKQSTLALLLVSSLALNCYQYVNHSTIKSEMPMVSQTMALAQEEGNSTTFDYSKFIPGNFSTPFDYTKFIPAGVNYTQGNDTQEAEEEDTYEEEDNTYETQEDEDALEDLEDEIKSEIEDSHDDLSDDLSKISDQISELQNQLNSWTKAFNKSGLANFTVPKESTQDFNDDSEENNDNEVTSIQIFDSVTGEPIQGATIDIYSTVLTYETDDNGETTEYVNLYDLEYVVDISKEGYIFKSGLEISETYELTPYHYNVSFVLSWNSTLGSNFTVVDEYNTIYAVEAVDADITTTDGEKIVVDEVSSVQYAAYSHFYSNEQGVGPSIQVFEGETLVNTISYEGPLGVTNSTKYWLAFCLDANLEVQVQNALFDTQPSVEDCEY